MIFFFSQKISFMEEIICFSVHGYLELSNGSQNKSYLVLRISTLFPERLTWKQESFIIARSSTEIKVAEESFLSQLTFLEFTLLKPYKALERSLCQSLSGPVLLFITFLSPWVSLLKKLLLDFRNEPFLYC